MATNHSSLSVSSWNINGGVLNKLALLEKMVEKHDIVCIQEHFLLPNRKNILQISRANSTLIYPASLQKRKGRPSGGLAVLSKYKFECLRSEDRFLGVSSNGLAIVNVYLPTNYSDQASEVRFNNACRKLAKYVKQLLHSFPRCLIIGNFNCDLSNDRCPRAQILKTMLPNVFHVLPKNQQFTFISVANTTSNIDHALFSGEPVHVVSVLNDFFV